MLIIVCVSVVGDFCAKSRSMNGGRTASRSSSLAEMQPESEERHSTGRAFQESRPADGAVKNRLATTYLATEAGGEMKDRDGMIMFR